MFDAPKDVHVDLFATSSGVYPNVEQISPLVVGFALVIKPLPFTAMFNKVSDVNTSVLTVFSVKQTDPGPEAVPSPVRFVMYGRGGRSAVTKALYVGVPDPPSGPANTVLAAALVNAKLKVGVVVGVVTHVVNSGGKLPELKLVTFSGRSG